MVGVLALRPGCVLCDQQRTGWVIVGESKMDVDDAKNASSQGGFASHPHQCDAHAKAACGVAIFLSGG